MPKTANEVFRDFVRFTGDGLPGEPVNAPLPHGDPSSGVHQPSKRDIREAFGGIEEHSIEARAAAELALTAMVDAQGATLQAASRAALLANTTPSYPVGTIFATRAEGYAYEVVSSGQDLTTAGGVKLKVVKGDVRAYGVTGDGTTNDTAAIARAFARGGMIELPPGTYRVNFDSLSIPNGTTIWCATPGAATLLGPTTDTVGADVQGHLVEIIGKQDITIQGIRLKNGYKGKGFVVLASKRINLIDCEVDGFTDGIWIGEGPVIGQANGDGCQDVHITRPRILNTSYWGIYVRGMNITDPAKMTRGTVVLNPYFQNCQMAGYVEAEGRVQDTLLESPVFQRCNVAMHFEYSEGAVIRNPRDYDTGKKGDHTPANTEYPFENWSLYFVYTMNCRVEGGDLESAVVIYASAEEPVRDITLTGLKYHELSLAQTTPTVDSDKRAFERITLDGCSARWTLFYQVTPGTGQPAYVRDLSIRNCKTLPTTATQPGLVVANGHGVTVEGCWFYDSNLEIIAEEYIHVLHNTWAWGTAGRRCLFSGRGATFDGTDCIVSNNTWRFAGTSGLYAAVVVEYCGRAHVAGNAINCRSTERGLQITNNFRLEQGPNFVTGETMQKVETAGSSSIATWAQT